MTEQIRKNLEGLKENIKQNASRVARKLSQSGAGPDPAVVFSTAKYYQAIKKLAKE